MGRTVAELMSSQISNALTNVQTWGGILYNVKAFGAKGDGVADDTSAIQKAIDAANENGGGVVYFPAGIYKISTRLILKSNVRLEGVPRAVIDMSSVSPVGTYRYGIYAAGSVGESVLLTSDAIKGNYSFNVANSSAFSVGDYIQLATQGVNFYPSANSPAYNVDRGEIKRIRNIVGNTIIFEESIYDNYTVANGAFIKKVSFVENISVNGLTLVGNDAPDSNEMGIYFMYVNGFDISNCVLENQDLYQIGLVSSIRGSVYDNRLRMSFYDGVTGSIFYSVAVIDCSQWIRIENNHAERTRHLFVCTCSSTGQGRWGCPRFILVTGNIAKDLMGGDLGRSWAYEHHGFGDAIVIDSNIADGCYGGVNIEGPGVIISNNIIRNWYAVGIEADIEGVDYRQIIISHNEIGDVSIENGGHLTPTAIRMYFQQGDILRNISIHGNVIRQDLTKSYGIFIVGNSNAPVTDSENIVVENNMIENIATTIGTNYALNISYIDRVVVRNNTIFGSAQGVIIQADDVVCQGNVFDYKPTDTPNVGYMIYTNGDNTVIKDNVIKKSYYGIRIDSGATDSIVMDNVVKSDNTTISDIGSNTVKQNNVEILY